MFGLFHGVFDLERSSSILVGDYVTSDKSLNIAEPQFSS
jgi:hypothetical protein